MENNEKKPAVSLWAEDIQWDVDTSDIVQNLQECRWQKAAEIVGCDAERWAAFTDSEKEDFVEALGPARRAEILALPSTVEVPEDVWKRQNEDDNAISNWLSDEYEFCHGGYKLKWKMSDERCRELLDKMVAYVGDHSVSLFEQISVLQANGFTSQDLLALGFDEGVLD